MYEYEYYGRVLASQLQLQWLVVSERVGPTSTAWPLRRPLGATALSLDLEAVVQLRGTPLWRERYCAGCSSAMATRARV